MRFGFLGKGEKFHIVDDENRALCNHQPVAEVYEDEGGPPEPRCRTCCERVGFPT